MAAKHHRKTRTQVVAHNPLDGEQLLLDAMFGQRPAASGRGSRPEPARPAAPPKPKPEHYKIVSISLYLEDIERLEALVKELKARGHTKANKSRLIRAALEQVDLDRVPNDR